MRQISIEIKTSRIINIFLILGSNIQCLNDLQLGGGTDIGDADPVGSKGLKLTLESKGAAFLRGIGILYTAIAKVFGRFKSKFPYKCYFCQN